MKTGMTRLLLWSFALMALIGAANAADLPPQAPARAPAMVPAPAPVYSWTGFYLNAGGGYGIWQAMNSTLTPAGVCAACATQTLGGRGYLGTAGGGFDYQFNDWLVAGIFADYDFMSLKGTIQDNFVAGFTGNINETWAWAAGVRGGWLITPQIFSYFNGGVTETRFGSASLTPLAGGAIVDTTPAFTKTGWFLGGGVETTLNLLGPGWFLRSEYRYSSYNTSNVPETGVGGAVVHVITFKPYVETLTTSLIYKFNWNGR
jgi:outer membrane immunogenic protein